MKCRQSWLDAYWLFLWIVLTNMNSETNVKMPMWWFGFSLLVSLLNYWYQIINKRFFRNAIDCRRIQTIRGRILVVWIFDIMISVWSIHENIIQISFWLFNNFSAAGNQFLILSIMSKEGKCIYYIYNCILLVSRSLTPEWDDLFLNYRKKNIEISLLLFVSIQN